jgi:hypothetical protein
VEDTPDQFESEAWVRLHKLVERSRGADETVLRKLPKELGEHPEI